MEVLSSRSIITPGDLARSRHFYETTLGLKVYREYGSNNVMTGVVFFLGGGFLELAGGTGSTASTGSTGSTGDKARANTDVGRIRLWLQVPDLRTEETRLRAAGANITRSGERMPWGLDEMWLEDPDGVEILLIEVPSDHPLRRRVD
ncbi:MAG: VOC family protein [Acidimicrobiales bacterium]